MVSSIYQNRIVAFIDILGFKNLIKKSEADDKKAVWLRDMLEIILRYKRVSEKFKKLVYSQDENSFEEVTVFSDSIVISYPLGDDSKPAYNGALYAILLDVIHLQLELARGGILVRGGIAVGKLYHKKEIVYGPAMVAAYELESKKAIYPRVIIDEESLKQAFILSHMEINTMEYEKNELDGLLYKFDDDDYYFVDFFNNTQEFDYPEYDQFVMMKKLRKMIKKGVKNKDNKINEKYHWVKRYYNDYINRGVFYCNNGELHSIS